MAAVKSLLKLTQVQGVVRASGDNGDTATIDISVDLKKSTETVTTPVVNISKIHWFCDKNASATITRNSVVIAHLHDTGHTDWFGSEPYNMGLSKRRAISAHKYLINKGINPNRIENAWFGEAKPSVSNMAPDGADDPDGRQLNRRVEIKVEIPEMADLYLSL